MAAEHFLNAQVYYPKRKNVQERNEILAKLDNLMTTSYPTQFHSNKGASSPSDAA